MTTDSASARDQILDAAERLFAHQGFDGVTIKEIGAASGQNPALLYYYFGSKEELYKAVLHRVVGSLVSRGGAAMEAALVPAEAIRRLVAVQVEFLLAEPHVPRLVIREMVDHDARRAQDVILELAAGLFQRLCGVIEAGQRSGAFRTDVEARHAAVSTIAQVVYFVIARPAIGLFYGLGSEGISDEQVRAFGRHAGDFAVRALSLQEPSS